MGDIFDGIEKAEQRKRANYLKPGVIEEAIVLEVKANATRKEEKFFAVELEVVKVKEGGSHKPGERVTAMTMKKWDGFLTDVREWVAAIFGVPFDKVDGSGVRLVTTKANPGYGAKVRIEAWNKETKSGNDFTASQWTHIAKPTELQERTRKAKEELAARAKPEPKPTPVDDEIPF